MLTFLTTFKIESHFIIGFLNLLFISFNFHAIKHLLIAEVSHSEPALRMAAYSKTLLSWGGKGSRVERFVEAPSVILSISDICIPIWASSNLATYEKTNWRCWVLISSNVYWGQGTKKANSNIKNDYDTLKTSKSHLLSFCLVSYGWRHSRMDQVKLEEDSL